MSNWSVNNTVIVLRRILNIFWGILLESGGKIISN